MATRADHGVDGDRFLIGSISAWSQMAIRPHGRIHPFLAAQAGFGLAASARGARLPYGESDAARDGVMVFALCTGAEWIAGWRTRIGIRSGYRHVGDLSLPGVHALDLNGPFVGAYLLLDAFSDD